uniref:Uncharacterized protein n=1 Tax=Vespula pensylvanica TaxID=30213 RepID=A0A834UCL6_VESPE|nr:hypothetical protein H0235_006401 [Vespula pensylvanica]
MRKSERVLVWSLENLAEGDGDGGSSDSSGSGGSGGSGGCGGCASGCRERVEENPGVDSTQASVAKSPCVQLVGIL